VTGTNPSARLLREAAKASSLAETQRLVGEAEQLRTAALAAQADARGLDLSNAVVRDTLTPVRVHEHHTAATDWIGSVDTAGDGYEHEMIAQGSLWYGKTAAIRPFRDEFVEQARGMARRLAGAYGERAPEAEHTFFAHVATLWNREVTAGTVKLAESGVPQVGEPGNPVAEATVGPSVDLGLDGAATSSERAPVIQVLDHNTSGPQLGHAEGHDAEAANGDTAPSGDNASKVPFQANRAWKKSNERNASMEHASCPTCQGRGRVAVRTQAASGLDQIDQVADPKDNPAQTPYPTDVMFPWEMAPGQIEQSIGQAEQQIAQREQLKGASRQARAMEAYRRVLAGQDDSGWLGDNGAGGVAPGQQDGGNPGPPSNLGQPDPVYGQGGDNGNQPLKPYGADEADDVTNNPGTWSLGQPTQADIGGRGQATAAKGDPEIEQALEFVRRRRAYLASQGR
jgi:hypothetical protein